MNREQQAAHARLASLPRTVNDASARAERERLAAWVDQHERAQRTRILRDVTFKTAPDEFGQRQNKRSRKGIKGGTHKGRKYRKEGADA